MKKFLVILLALCIGMTIVVPMLGISASEKEIQEDISWYSADKTEYVISTPGEFLGISYVYSMHKESFKNKTIKLAENIRLNSGNAADWATSEPVNIFIPVGTTELPFEGTFDGQGHSISGLFAAGTSDIGIFNFARGATFKNFSIINSYIYGSGDRVGGIVGRIRDVSCTFENIYSEVIVKGNVQVGGFVGSILNYAEGGTFDKCVFAGKAEAGQIVGGFIGDDSGAFNVADRPNTRLTVFTNCANYGTIKATNETASYVGGITGSISHTKITLSINAGEIIGKDQGGGITGRIAGSWIGKIEKSYTCTDVLSGVTTKVNSTVGGVHYSITDFTDTAAEFTRASVLGTGARTALAELDFVNVWADIPNELPMLRSALLLIEQSKIEPPVPQDTDASTTAPPSGGSTTTTATTTAPADGTTTSGETKKSGCKSSVSSAVIWAAAITAAGTFLLIAKRKKSEA